MNAPLRVPTSSSTRVAIVIPSLVASSPRGRAIAATAVAAPGRAPPAGQPNDAIASTRRSTKRARSMSTPASTFGRQPPQALPVGDGPAPGQLAGRLDVHPQQLGRDEARRGEVGDRDGVVDRRAVPAVAVAVVDGEEAEEVDPDPRDPRAERLEAGDVGLQEERPVGHVEAHHRDRDPAPEDDRGRLRVLPDVELGGRRRVPLPQRAAHEADPLDPLADARPRPQEERDVRERAGRHERDRAVGRRHQRLRQRQRTLRPRRRRRLRQVGAVEAALAVELDRDPALAEERPLGAGARPGRRSGRGGPGPAARCGSCWRAASCRRPS